MRKKNLISHTLRSGLLMTAAATLLMANMAVYAAEGDPEEPAGIFWENDLISGTVTEVGADSITVKVSGIMDETGFEAGMPGDRGMGMPGGFADGQTPPERPEGEMPELPDGQTPPERPEGEMPELPDGQTPPERPEGEMPELPEGQTPPERPEGEMPEGQPQGGRGMGAPQGEGQMRGGRGMSQYQNGSDAVVSVDSNTAVLKGDAEASLSDITTGTNVMVILDGSRAQTIVILD